MTGLPSIIVNWRCVLVYVNNQGDGFIKYFNASAIWMQHMNYFQLLNIFQYSQPSFMVM